MSKRRKESLRQALAAQRERSKTWPVGFDSGYLRFYRTRNHVVTVRCAMCHRPALLLLAPVSSTTPEQIIANGQLLPASRVVRNPCSHRWIPIPEIAEFRAGINRSVKRGLGSMDENLAVVMRATPGSKDCPSLDEGLD